MGSQFFWHGQISVEQNVKFNEDTIVLLNTMLLKGENGISDQQHVSDVRSVPDNSSNTEVVDHNKLLESPTQTPSTNNWLGTTFNHITDELVVDQSHQVWPKSDYIKWIESGEGTANN